MEYADVNEYRYVRIPCIVDEREFTGYDPDYWNPVSIYGSGKYQVYEIDAGDEFELWFGYDMYGLYEVVGIYMPMWSDTWAYEYDEACKGNKAAVDYIMRVGMVDEGFRTMTAYGYETKY